jgi:hypothetical protein
MVLKNRSGEQFSRRSRRALRSLVLGVLALGALSATVVIRAQNQATDPGLRSIWCPTCTIGVGGFQTTLTGQEKLSEPAATIQFNMTSVVTCASDGSNVTGCGLGPRFNSNSCSSCHSQPVAGGSSPATNPLFQIYQSDGVDSFNNTMPSFETQSGPVLVPRLPASSGGTGLVQQLFTIAGTSYPGCSIQQPNFAAETGVVYRQPLPTFGDGYIDFIENKDILNVLNSNLPLKNSLGIIGMASMDGSDGSVDRFGWKAQWRAILPAIGAEEQVEEGITNEMLPTEVDQTSGCDVNPVPEDPTNYSWYGSSMTPWLFLANAERDAIFVRFLSTPIPATTTNGSLGCPGGNLNSCTQGAADFNNIGCALCHNPSYTTPPGSIPSQGHTRLYLYSDLLLHHMGSCLADNITQGSAQGDMFRTPPLWNIGQRIWFLHDGRTSDIVQAIEAHADNMGNGPCTGTGSYPASEADAVIAAFNNLVNVSGVDGTAQQDLINFLRSL